MRILISNHFPLEGSGSGVYTENLAKELVHRGHEVQVIVPEHYRLEDREFGITTILFSKEGELKRHLPFNFPCFTTHPRSHTTFYDLSLEEMETYIDTMVQVTAREVERFKPTIIHCQHLWITPYAASKTERPYVITAHGTDLKGFQKDPRYHPYVLSGALKAERIITISKQVHEETLNLYRVKEERLTRVMNGFDQKIFYPRKEARRNICRALGFTKDTIIITFVGKLAHFKGVDTLLRAAAIYERELERVETLIIGEGEKREELEGLKEELHLQGVHFLGHHPQESLATYYSAAHLSIVPSRVEPFGLVAIEALACGTPVIASKEGGLPDFIHNGVGSLFSVDNHKELAETIIREVKSSKLDEKGRESARYALEGFSWRRVVKEVEEIYREVVPN